MRLRLTLYLALTALAAAAQDLRLPPPEYSYFYETGSLNSFKVHGARSQNLEVVEFDGLPDTGYQGHTRLLFDFAAHRVSSEQEHGCRAFNYSPSKPLAELDPVGGGGHAWLFAKPLDPKVYKPRRGNPMVNGVRTRIVDESEAGPGMIRYYVAIDYDFPVMIKAWEWKETIFHIKRYHGGINEQVKDVRFAKPDAALFRSPSTCESTSEDSPAKRTRGGGESLTDLGPARPLPASKTVDDAPGLWELLRNR